MFTRIRARFNDWLARNVFVPPPPPTLISTHRLLLRDLELADVPSIYAYRSDPAVTRYLDALELHTEEEVKWFVHAAREQSWSKNRAFYLLGIVLREEDRLIGECSLGLLFPVEQGVSADAATIGFVLHPDYWGQGYATEVASALLRFGFVDLEYVCVYGGCLEENTASRRVLEKVGMTFQGTQADFPGCPTGFNSLVFTLDRSEWMKQQEKLAQPEAARLGQEEATF